jgi:organic hydroperoxide reductase OsmC/OhrA
LYELKLLKHQKSYSFRNTVLKKGDKSTKTVFSGPREIEVGPAPEFEGSSETLNPEEMFVVAIKNCLMTTSFYFVRKLNVEILSYYLEAQGWLEKQKDEFRFTHVGIQAEITLA